MGAERGFNYPVQIFKEAVGWDAFEKSSKAPLPVRLLSGAHQFIAPLHYRTNSLGRKHTIPRDATGIEMSLWYSSMFIGVSVITANLPLHFGIKIGLNLLSNAGADFFGYISYKRRLEEIIRTEKL